VVRTTLFIFVLSCICQSWDEEIANTAQRWAENCLINHDENYKRYAYGKYASNIITAALEITHRR